MCLSQLLLLSGAGFYHLVMGGMALLSPGIWLRADLARISWNVTPANSGVCTERTRLLSFASPGNADGSVAAIA